MSACTCVLASTEIRVAAQDSAPKFFVNSQGKMSGLSVDIMRAVERDNPEIRFTGYEAFTPFKRMELALQAGTLDAFFGFLKNEQREALYNILPTPIFSMRYVMAVRKTDPLPAANWDTVRGLGKDGAVLTLFGTGNVDYLINVGGLVIDSQAQTVPQLLSMLVAGRGRFAYYYDSALIYGIREAGLEAQVRLLPDTHTESLQYVVFSKKADPVKVALVKKSLERLKANGVLDAIGRRYGAL